MTLLPRRLTSVRRVGDARRSDRRTVTAVTNSQIKAWSCHNALPHSPTNPQTMAARARHNRGFLYANTSAGTTRNMTSTARPERRRAARSKCVVVLGDIIPCMSS